MTSPTKGPVKLTALVAFVAVVALPDKLPVTLPVKFAVIVLAIKFPEASRSTIVFGVLVFVAALAAMVAAAMLVALCPPTLLTTVAFCVPITSPESDPEKFVAVYANSVFIAVVADRCIST